MKSAVSTHKLLFFFQNLSPSLKIVFFMSLRLEICAGQIFAKFQKIQKSSQRKNYSCNSLEICYTASMCLFPHCFMTSFDTR